jgi:glutaredoxin 3
MANPAMVARRGNEAAPQKKILNIYTAATCGFCQRAKALLEQYKIAYVEHPVDDNSDERQWVVEHADGRKVLPQLFVDGRHLGGFFELKRYCLEGTLPLILMPG